MRLSDNTNLSQRDYGVGSLTVTQLLACGSNKSAKWGKLTAMSSVNNTKRKRQRKMLCNNKGETEIGVLAVQANPTFTIWSPR